MNAAIRIIGKTVLFYSLVILGATFVMYTLLWAAPGDIRDILCAKGCSESRKVEIAKERNLVRDFARPVGLTLVHTTEKAAVVRLQKGTWSSADVGRQLVSDNSLALVTGVTSKGVASVKILKPFSQNPAVEKKVSVSAGSWYLVEEEWLLVQYGHWLSKVVRFDFGTSVSFSQGAPIAGILKRASLLTSGLVFGAALLSILLAFFLIWRPVHRVARWAVRMGQVPLSILSFVPLYILAYWLVMVSGRLPLWLSEAKMFSASTRGWIAQSRQHLIDIGLLPFGQELEWTNELGWLFLLPFFLSMLLLALGNNNLVEQTSGVRAEFNQLRLQHFMRAVRARGTSWMTHLTYNLLLPLTQFFTARAILLLGTVVIIESIMGITGIGWLLWEATKRRDTPLVLAIALFATALSCLLQMLNEIALQLIDPRLRKD